jgi:hypothetical protein
MSGNDEEEERLRQQRELKSMSLRDRLHGGKPLRTSDGFPDQRSERRTGRIILMPFRVHPRVKALILAIKKRDNVPSLPVLLEVMLEAYQERYGPIDESELPSDEELIERFEQEQDRRNGR